MDIRTCTFETDRLIVKEWHSLSISDLRQRDLASVVAAIMTEPVTRWLPVSWQGTYSDTHAREWIEDRDEEGTTLLVIDKSTHSGVGLMILFESQDESGSSSSELRLGYMLSEDTWGRGIATELVSGFVKWCRGQKSISSIIGGVAVENLASIRVLEKSGFQLDDSNRDVGQDEQLYRLTIR
jgi:RimJ/RimL family protein N-acetyltransferase